MKCCAVIGAFQYSVFRLPATFPCLSYFHLCRYWWLKLKTLAEKEEWEELEKFSKYKKSPIGYLVRRRPAFYWQDHLKLTAFPISLCLVSFSGFC